MAQRRESGKFAAQYRRLNAEQKRAVDAIEGPVIVIAGPGTGKTQILTLRIAQILRKTDTPPDAILALTFTESAAFAMRRRLIDIIGAAAYRVRIHTFHGYANTVIERFPESFPRIIGSRAASDVERYSMLKEIIASAPLTHSKPYGQPFFYLGDIAARIAELKRENISPDEWERACAEREAAFEGIPHLRHEKGAHAGEIKGSYAQMQVRLGRDRDLLAVYRAYEAELARRRLYDYEDMLLEVIRAFERDRGLLLALQEESLYILADEHQDANEAQNRLLELLASFHPAPNLFVVGDEKQAIFRFQGASLDNFLYFKNKYPDAAVIVLRENYRSRQEILDAAHSLAERMPVVSGVERLPLIAVQKNTAKGEVRVLSLPRPEDERLLAAREIRRLVDEGVDPDEIAALVRVNRDADEMGAALQRLGVAFFIESQRSALDASLARKFAAILEAIANFGQDEHLVPALHVDFLELPQLDVARLLAASGRRRIGSSDKKPPTLSERISDAKELRKIGIKRPAPFTGFAKKLARWHALDRSQGLLPVLDAVLEESGMLPYALKAGDPDEGLAVVSAFFEEARALQTGKRNASARDFLAHLALLEEFNLPLAVVRTLGARSAVRIMTAHRAKGLEFSYVYILHVNDGKWGNRTERRFFSPAIAGAGTSAAAAQSDIDDERRLLYVALTRAKISATVTYARERESGALALPAQFVEELSPRSVARQELASESPGLFSGTPGPARLKLDRAFTVAALNEQGFSVTALNNYLDCPWKYFYRNLLRVPEAPEKSLEYGVAIHTALKHYFDLFKEGDDIGKKGLLQLFLRALGTAALSESEYRESLARGRTSLGAYWTERHRNFGAAILNELQITVFLAADISGLPRIRLRGVLDKLEFGEGTKAVVYDYKTGSRKTRGIIEGKGNDPRDWGDYKRQLLFYRLLLSLSGRWQMQRGIIDFVEPDRRGVCVREIFDMENEQAERDESALADLVRKIAKEIYTFAFARKRCGKQDCKYCRLRDLLER